MNLKPDQLIDQRYKVIEKIGEGGMGEVWKAVDIKHGDDVVIKMPLFQHDQTILKRFKRESQLMRKHSVENPHILNIEDIGELDGVPWYVMRHLPGGSVNDRSLKKDDQGNVQWSDSSFDWLGKIASALDYLHDNDAFHRDVKPANILFSKNGTPYLVDFGIVKTVNETTSMVTEQGKAVGTMAYMPPEVLDGEKFEAQSDQYSLAVTLYEFLTGERPFSGTTFFSLFKSIQKGHRKLNELAPLIPAAASNAVDRALSPHPSDRFDSCQEFYHAFLTGMTDSETTADHEEDPVSVEDGNEEKTRAVNLRQPSKPPNENPDNTAPSPLSSIPFGNSSDVGEQPTARVDFQRANIPPALKQTPARSSVKGWLVALVALSIGGGIIAATTIDWSGSVAQIEKEQTEFREKQAELEETANRNAEAERQEHLRQEKERVKQEKLAAEEKRRQEEREEELRIAEQKQRETKRVAEQKRAAERDAEPGGAISFDSLSAGKWEDAITDLKSRTPRRARLPSAVEMLVAGSTILPGVRGQQPAAFIALAPLAEQQKTIKNMAEASGYGSASFLIKSQIRAFTKGLDTKKRSGVIFSFDSDGSGDFEWLLMLPLEDEDEFLDTLANAAEIEEDSDGIALTLPDENEVYGREESGYFCFSQRRSVLDRIPSSPRRLLDAMPDQYLISAQLNPQLIPASVRQSWIDTFVQFSQDNANGSEPFDIDSAIEQASSLINDTESLTLGILEDTNSETLSIDFAARGISGSQMAVWQAGASRLSTQFSGFATRDDIFQFNYLDKLTPKQIAIAGIQIDSFMNSFLSTVTDEFESPVNRVSAALKETARNGTVDCAAFLTNELNFAGGMRISDPVKIESAFRDLFQELADSENGDLAIKLNAHRLAGIRVHEFTVGNPENEDFENPLYGNYITILLGVADRSAYLAYGKDPLPTLRDAITRSRNTVSPTHNIQVSTFLDSLPLLFEESAPLAVALEKIGARGNIAFKFNPTRNGFSTRLELQYGMLALIEPFVSSLAISQDF